MISLDIPVTSELHRRIIKAACDRKKYSERKMNEFKRQWDEADDSMRAYIPEKEADRVRKEEKKQGGKVDYVTLEVPYIYAQVMTAHTYWSTIFMSRTPIWQFSARHGETQDSIDAVEAVMDYQVRCGGQIPVLYNWLYDWARYSLGIVGIYWDQQVKVVSQYEEVPKTFLGVPLPGKTEKKRVEKEIPGFVGNRLYNVRPYDFFPDPRVPIWRFQDGEFVIRESTEGWSDLVSCMQSQPGYYINIKQLSDRLKAKKGQPADYNQGSPRVNLPLSGEEANLEQPGAGFVKIRELYIKLIPSEWGLNGSKKMQKWVFTIADDEVVIRACPLGYLHDEFPFAVVEGNFGNDSFAKWGMIELIRPMTDIMTWLVNSHFYNVRKTLNDTRVVDPTGVVIKDLERAVKGAGGIIRLKPAAYGRDVRQFLMQLQNADATQSHFSSIAMVEQMMQKASGAVDNIMGMQNASSRKSATEARISSNWAMNRLKTPAEYNSALGFDRVAQIMLSNTQQLLDIQRKYAIAGNTLSYAKTFIEVGPELIAGEFNWVPVDGTMPIDPMAKAQFWKELILGIGKDPNLAMQWDLGGMISHMMKIQGERNIDRFRVQVLPPGVMPGPNGMPVPMAGPQGVVNGPQPAGPLPGGAGPRPQGRNRAAA